MVFDWRRPLLGTPVNGMELIWKGDAIGAGGRQFARRPSGLQIVTIP
jgi:hypothetical protein